MGRDKHKDRHEKKKRKESPEKKKAIPEKSMETPQKKRKSHAKKRKSPEKNITPPDSTSVSKLSSTRSSSSESSSSRSSSSSSESTVDVNPKRRGSTTSSLRSKTFDLREFAGMEPEPPSSSPSMADTIIARGVEYKGLHNERYAQVAQASKASKQGIDLSSDAPSRSKSENFLQPEEFLNVDAKRFVKRPAGRMQRNRDRFIVNHFDEDRISIVNYRAPHGRHSPHYVTRMDQNFSPINYFDPNQSGNSLRSTFETEEQFRSWKENAPNKASDDRPARNGWHHPHQEPPPEKETVKKLEPQPPLTFWEVLEKSLFGNAPLLQELLKERERIWYWWPCIFIECFLRSISAVSLAPNPLSGFIILVTMLVVKPIATLIGCLALFTGILTAIFVVEIPTETVRGGGVAFNAFIMGVIMGELSDTSSFSLYFAVVLASIVIIFIYCAMQGIVKNTNLPILNAPFNIAAFIYFTCGLAAVFKANDSTSNIQGVQDTKNTSVFIAGNISRLFGHQDSIVEATQSEEIDWVKVLRGILISPSQLYLTDTIGSSAFVFLAWFIYSPTLALQSLLGATIGSFVGTALDEPPYKQLYNAGWCYNSLLTCSALGGMFYLLNIKSWILSVVGALFTALVFGAFLKADLEALGIPFMLVTWLFLPVSVVDEHKRKQTHGQSSYQWFALLRIPNHEIQTPEAHLHLYCKNQYKPGRVVPKGEGNGVPGELHL